MTPLRFTISACTVRTVRTVRTVCAVLAACTLTSAALGKTIDLSGEFGFSVRWDRELGSGYSKVALADDLAVTMFSSGDVDVIAAIDPSTGEERWRYELGERHLGHGGSDDGPLSSPTIADGRVFVVAPRGSVTALALTDGSELWTYRLHDQNSHEPFYGFTTTPVMAAGHVIVATGGDGHAMTAFDPATGAVRWTAGNDTVRYQTPSLLDLGGRTTLVLVGDRLIQGFDPASGEIRFTHAHGEAGRSSESSHLTDIGDERFVVNHYGGESAMYRFTEAAIEEVWRSRAFRGSLAVPVFVDGYLYGFTGRFLTCADPDTGEIVWRSRPPQARAIAVAEGKLAVLASSGDLVLIEPTPEGYQELTRGKIFEAGDVTPATYADGAFFLRNLERMAVVTIDETAAPEPTEVDLNAFLAGEMRSWVSSVLELPEAERQAAVDARFDRIETSPIFEGDGLVHFYYRGVAEDVGLVDDSGVIADQSDNTMIRVAGTDLFVRSAELDPRAQYTYAYAVDYGEPTTDPWNPHRVDMGSDAVSDLRMPRWPASPHLDEPAAGTPRGILDSFVFRSDVLDNTRQIQVWRPDPTLDDAGARHPLLVVNHGDNLLRGGLMRNTLDNLVGTTVAPIVVAFVPRVEGAEYGGAKVDDYLRFLTEELVPHLERHYQTDTGSRAIMGPASAGLTSVYAALEHPDVFHRAAAQSLYPIEPSYERIAERIAEAGPSPQSLHLVWSRHDYDLGGGTTAESTTKELIDLLRAAGIQVTEQIADYTPGWGGWRGQHDDILAVLFPHRDSSDRDAGRSGER